MKRNSLKGAWALLCVIAIGFFACQQEAGEYGVIGEGKIVTKADVSETKVVEMKNPGTFASFFNKGEMETVRDLTISGPLDASDIDTLRTMSKLENLNISNVHFVESDKTYTYYTSWGDKEGKVITNEISSYMFTAMNHLTQVTLPAKIVAIGNYAFAYCSNLVSVKMPDTIKNIGQNVFYSCSSLAEVKLPNSLDRMGSEAFYNCSGLASVEIPDGVTIIPSSAFENCRKLTSVKLSDGIVEIKSSAFSKCSSLKTIKLPKGLKSFSNAFQDCTELSSIEIPAGVSSIEYAAFYNCTSLISVKLHEGLVYIKEKAFRNCANLVTVDIPNTVIDIAYHAFLECHSLSTLTIPESVTNLENSSGYAIVQQCENLTSLFWNSGAMVYEQSGVNPNCVLYLSKNVPVRGGWINIVASDGTAEKIELVEGFPFYCPKAFKAKEITYKCAFHKETIPGQSAGWNTIILPFEAQNITHEDGRKLTPFDFATDEIGRNFWLRKLVDDEKTYENVTVIQANTPYIIAMPNSTDYDPDYNITGNVVFKASDKKNGITISSTLESYMVDGTDYSMFGTFRRIPMSSDIYVLNAAGESFERSISAVGPFQAYLVPHKLSTSVRSFSLNGSANTRSGRPLGRKPSISDM